MQGVQARRKALRIRYINGIKVRKKRPWGVQERGPGGSSELPEPPICCSLALRATMLMPARSLAAPIFRLLVTTTTLCRRLERRYSASFLRSGTLLFCLIGWKSGAGLHARPVRIRKRVANFRCLRFVCSIRSTRIPSSIARSQAITAGSRSPMLCFYRS